MAKRPRKANKIAELAARLDKLEGKPANGHAVDVGASNPKLLAAALKAASPEPAVKDKQATQAAAPRSDWSPTHQPETIDLDEEDRRAETIASGWWYLGPTSIGQKIYQFQPAALRHGPGGASLRLQREQRFVDRLNDSIIA